MTTHVFLGPTLGWDDALRILPKATIQPPASAGDVYLAVKAGASVIAVIDGYFEQVPSVWHKEVLYALSRGVRVFGASSMGTRSARGRRRSGSSTSSPSPLLRQPAAPEPGQPAPSRSRAA